MNKLEIISSDPANYGLGFARAHWTSRGMVVFFGNSHNPFGNNSIRAFDPVTNFWTFLWPNELMDGETALPATGISGLQNRDNYASLYVPRLDELWIWGGSGLEAWPTKTGSGHGPGPGPTYRSGRFRLRDKTWIARGTTDADAFSSVVANFGGFLPDAGCAWSDAADMGMTFGGSDGGNVSSRYWIIERSFMGLESYRMAEIIGGTRPPPRAQAQNTLVAVGKDFYLFGGAAGGNLENLKDLWKFDTSARAWTQLLDAPAGSYTPCITYDSTENAIMAWVNDKLYAFYIQAGIWTDRTPEAMPCIFNQVGVYAPTAKKHLFEGGNKCADGGTPGSGVFAISVSGGGTEVEPGFPLRKFIARPNPPYQLDVRDEFVGQRGFGPSMSSKHQRLVYNPDNKRIYFYSGDYPGPPFPSSYKTNMFSYDITKSLSSPDVSDFNNWVCEWPYCGLPGKISPTNTDEAPFAWDSKRHVFWITGGWEVGGADAVSKCSNGAITWGNDSITVTAHGPGVLQFDPARNIYIDPGEKFKLPAVAVDQNGIPVLGGSQTPRHSVYNPVTDEIIMIGLGRTGTNVMRMNCETGKWTTDSDAAGNSSLAHDSADGSYINDTNGIHEQLALDVRLQFIYWIDTFHKQDPNSDHRFRLMRYDIADHTMESLGWIDLPDFGDPYKFPFYVQPYDSTMLAYDSVNNVVLWPASSNEGRPILMIYHPDPDGGKNGTWEVDPMSRDKPGEIVFGSNGTFIEELNLLIIYGGFGTPNSDFFEPYPEIKAPANYFWLYRYAGDGPSHGEDPISTLKATFVGYGDDKTGETTPNPDGKPDFHVSLSGLRGTPIKVTITNDTDGTWETPFNGANWLIATHYGIGDGLGDLWFSQYPSTKFHIKTLYVDGSTDETDVDVIPEAAKPDVIITIKKGLTYQVMVSDR